MVSTFTFKTGFAQSLVVFRVFGITICQVSTIRSDVIMRHLRN